MNRTKKKFLLPLIRGRFLALAFMAAALGVLFASLMPVSPEVGIAGLLLLPLLGSTLTEDEFQSKVLKGVESLQDDITKLKPLQAEVEKLKAAPDLEKILAEPDRWPKAMKTLAEENIKLKATANGFDSEIKKLQSQLRTLEALAKLEARGAYGDPIARFCADEEKRDWLNAVTRRLKWPDAKLPAHLEKALTGVDSSLGQAVIPTHYIPELYDVLKQYGQYNTLRVDSGLSARTNSYPIMTARPTAVWIGAGSGAAEGTAITPGDFAGTSVNLSIQTAAALLYASREQLQDATVDMSSLILREIAQSVTKLLDDMAFTADGGADQVDAGYYGIFETDTVHTGSDATASSAITVGTTTLDDWVRCLTTVSQPVLNLSPRWWINPQILAKVCLIRDDNGRPIFQNALEAPSPTVGSILGAPVNSVAAAPFADETGAKVAVYGDPQGYVVGIRQDMELATSEHIKFAENQIGFRAIVRAGGKHRIPTGNPAGHIPFAVLTLA